MGSDNRAKKTGTGAEMASSAMAFAFQTTVMRACVFSKEVAHPCLYHGKILKGQTENGWVGGGLGSTTGK